MSESDYHRAMVEAGEEAIEQGRYILNTTLNGRTECVAHRATPEKPRTLGDLLREAKARGLAQNQAARDLI